MRRLRVALVLLIVALAIPVGLLVARALQSAELEERVRHEAIADRIFDEMERTLSDYLAQEEARTPDAYRFYPGRPDGASRERSPLSRPAAEPFVIAHFQIQPDGSLRTPLRPVDRRAAERAGDWPPPDSERVAVERAVALLEQEVVPFWRDAEQRRQRLAAGRVAPADLEEVLASPPSGKAESAPTALADAAVPSAEGVPSPAVADDDRKASAYELLQSLNVGARKRAKRRQQVQVDASQPAPSRQRAAAPPGPAEPPGAGAGIVARSVTEDGLAALAEPATPAEHAEHAEHAEREAKEAFDQAAQQEAAPYFRQSAESSSLGGAFASRQASPMVRADTPERDEPVRVVLEPMAGRPLGKDHLMLYRTVLVDGEGFRQGLLLDRAALGTWLADEVIGQGPIAELAAVQFGSGARPAAAPDRHAARHRFAEPFSGLIADLRVGPLQGSSSTAAILMLAAGLGVVALFGVWAVHRMASVVVDFAERRSNFVAAVSHELKTPLTAIRMHGEMLRDGLVPSDRKRDEYYRTITDESERLSRLIDNVLEFSRLEKGQRPLSAAVGSPATVVSDIVERLRPHAEREGFALTAEVVEPIPSVRFDRDALAQMIFNLIDNAIKYAAESDPKRISVRCEPTEAGGVAVSVRDFGPGVPREQLVRIFEPFHRVEAELTRTTKGSGIGLSLVKQLGDAMGAAVTGDCPEDGGFRVRIAFTPAAA